MVTSMNALYFTASIKDLWSTSLSIARLSNLAFFFFFNPCDLPTRCCDREGRQENCHSYVEEVISSVQFVARKLA